MALVYIGLGSNIGNGRHNIQQAWGLLQSSMEIKPLALSNPYLTSPVGMESKQWFTNAVGVLETSCSASKLLYLLQHTEKNLGRDRSKGEDRTIDLDILYYDNLIIQTEELIIPHPGLESRLFVLEPLKDLAPDKEHPISGLTTTQMIRKVQGDKEQSINKISWSEQV